MFMPRSEVAEIAFEACGDPLFIDTHAVIYGAERIRLGSNVRIDAGVLLSAATGRIELGSRVHISAGVQVYGGGTVRIDDLACVSPRATLLSATDDFRGPFLSGPLVPDPLRNVLAAPISCERYSLVGCGAVVLPGVTIGKGATIGALSLVIEDVPPGAIMAGAPARQVGARDLDELERLANQLDNPSAEDSGIG